MFQKMQQFFSGNNNRSRACVCVLRASVVSLMPGLFFSHFSKKLKENKLKESEKLKQFFEKTSKKAENLKIRQL